MFIIFSDDCFLCIGPGSIWRDDACFCDDPFSESPGEEADEGICNCGENNQVTSNKKKTT